MADRIEISSENSSSASSPTLPPPKRKKTPAKQSSASGKGARGKYGHRHKVRKGKMKRKYVSSTSSSSSSHDSADSESPETESHRSSSRRRTKVKRAHGSKKDCSTATKQQSDLFAIYRKHSSKIVDLTSTCVIPITSKLFARNLIPEAVQGQVITGQGSDHDKAVKVLYAVQQRIKSDPEKLRTLVQVLEEEPVFDDLIKEITSDIEKEVDVFSHNMSGILQCYKDYLKKVYNSDPSTRDDKLDISPCSTFISLALVHKSAFHDDPFSKSTFHGGVDEILARKTHLDLDDLVTPGSPLVLVEGPPGIGKSTMCWELCRKWDTLKSLHDFKIVLHLKLREKRVQNATSLHQLFYHDDKRLCKGIVDLVLSCHGEGVLLVLDGFDELPSSVVDDESSLIMRLIRGQCLPSATRLVTSRPSALYKRKCFPKEHQHVEILGFTDEYKIEFAEKTFKSRPKILTRFKKFIFSNPIITSLMYIPVNCAIIAQVYIDLPDITVPKTMTQLYTLLVLVLIRRHLIQTGRWTEESKVPASLESLPGDIKADLMRVSKLAYEGLIKEDVQVMFSDEDVGENFQHLGLLNEAKEMYVSKGAVTYYSFLHLSIQEFLAAWYVSCCPHLMKNAASSLFQGDGIRTHLIAFGRFLSGMCNFADLLDEFKVKSPPRDDFLIFCYYEAQDTSCSGTFKYIIKRWGVKKKVGDKLITPITLANPLDVYMFGYVLVHVPIQWSLGVGKCFDMLALSVANYADKIVLGSIVELSVSSPIADVTKLSSCLLESIKIFRTPTDFGEQVRCARQVISKARHEIYWKLAKLEVIVFSSYSNEMLNGLDDFFTVTSSCKHFVLSPGFNFAYGNFAYSIIATWPGEYLWKCQKVANAALSCSSLNRFSTTIPFLAFNMSSSVKEINFIIGPDYNTSVMVLFNCLCSIAGSGSLSTIRILCVGLDLIGSMLMIKLPPELLCTFLAVSQSSLHSNPELYVEILNCFYFSLSYLPSLSRAFRKDPDVVRLNLRRSKSLPDLTTPRLSLSDLQVPRESIASISRHQSCPDLLELESLWNMHPKLHKAIGFNDLNERQLSLHQQSRSIMRDTDMYLSTICD